MAYVPVPKDLNAVKTKVLLNLTKRQLICFGAGAALGVPLFFLLKAHTGVSTAAICMILLMLPFFLLAITAIVIRQALAGAGQVPGLAERPAPGGNPPSQL